MTPPPLSLEATPNDPKGTKARRGQQAGKAFTLTSRSSTMSPDASVRGRIPGRGRERLLQEGKVKSDAKDDDDATHGPASPGPGRPPLRRRGFRLRIRALEGHLRRAL